MDDGTQLFDSRVRLLYSLSSRLQLLDMRDYIARVHPHITFAELCQDHGRVAAWHSALSAAPTPPSMLEYAGILLSALEDELER